MIRNKILFFLAGLSLPVFLWSCRHDPLEVDVSEIPLTLDVIRLDEAVFNANWDSALAENQRLYSEFDGYYRLFTEFILNAGTPVDDPATAKYMAGFAGDETMNDFYREEQKLFGGEKFVPYIEEFTSAFKHYKYYFPSETVPVVFTYQSGFNYKVVPNDTLLGIGLEWYIGKDNELIKRLSPEVFPQYEKDKMIPEYLVVDGVKGFLKVKYQKYLKMDNLLSVMIFYGKIMYLTDAMLHHKPDYVKINYSEDEWKWCKENEKLIWIFLAENNLLFSSSMRDIVQWINDGPFTTGLPQESPSRIGIWMGWQMVRQYMDKHPGTPLNRLMEIEDSNRFLNTYKPGK